VSKKAEVPFIDPQKTNVLYVCTGNAVRAEFLVFGKLGSLCGVTLVF